MLILMLIEVLLQAIRVDIRRRCCFSRVFDLIWSFSSGPCGVQPVPDFTDKRTIALRFLFFFFCFVLINCRVVLSDDVVRLTSGIVTVL